MINFSQTISASIEWTTAVLFRPFRPKKWLILGFVALLAGQLAGAGCNSSYSPSNRDSKSADSKITPSTDSSAQAAKKTAESKQAIYSQLQKIKNNPRLLIIIILLFILIALFFTWLYCRFSFVFIDDIVHNDASVKIPFTAHKNIANSLFGFYLACAALSLLVFGGIIFMLFLRIKGLGGFSQALAAHPLAVFLVCLPYIGALILALFLFAVIYMIVRDFVQPAMFKTRLSFAAAWNKILYILDRHIGAFLLYIMVRIAVAICAWTLCSLAYMVVMLALIVQGVIVALACAGLYKLLPAGMHLAYAAALLIMAIPVLLFLLYCLMCVYLPFAVFCRTFSLKFLASIVPEYDLFRSSRTTEV